MSNTEINREQFEAWLYAQDRDKPFNYEQGGITSEPGCVMCQYLRENGYRFFFVGGVEVFWDIDLERGRDGGPLPFWFLRLTFTENGLQQAHTLGQAQDLYTKLFGHPYEQKHKTTPAPVPEAVPDHGLPQVRVQEKEAIVPETVLG